MSSDASHLETIFFVALEIQNPEARAVYLAEACGQDDELRERVEQMLAVQSKVSYFMEHPPAAYAGTVHLEKEILDAGLSAGFGPGEAVVIGSANHSVLKSLGRTLDEVPRVLLRDPKEAGSDPIVRPRSKEIPADHADSRYQLAGEIARGGMGAIIKGRDIDLGRDLAIKVLLDAHKDKPEVVQRFIEEAQIGGQLQHPGIVPVYELGQFGDQRPFFSMKLVKGETLAGLLSARKNPAEDRAKFLGIYEQVCQTMAYAHSRGVIHRDLKPANIMVGAFGEVQVMDWGLAKVLAAGGIADEKKSLEKQVDVSVIQTRRSLGSDSPGSVGSLGSQTQMGSVMGTPAYMSPEQALGEVDRLDERTDVFGLGAILCEILTGKPPYVATSGEQVFRLASRGKLDDCFARLDAAVIDAELRQIVRDALALEPDDRLRDAGVLAGRISGYLESVESRLRQAEVDRATETARAEEALKTAAQELVSRREAQGRVVEELRRRRVTMALAASLLIGVIGIGWFALHAREQQKRAEVARQNALLAQQAAETSQQSEILQRQAADAARVSEAAQRMVAEDQRDNATALSDALALEKQELSRQKEEQRRMLYTSDMNLIQSAWAADNVGRVIELLNAHRPQPGQTDLRGFEWHYWNRQCHQDLQTMKLPASLNHLSVVFSANAMRLAGVHVESETRDRTIKVWDTESGAELLAVPLLRSHSASTISLALHPDGNRLAVTTLAQDGSLELKMYDITTRAAIFSIRERSNPDQTNDFLTRDRKLWISDDGMRLAMTVNGGEDNGTKQSAVGFWDAGTGEKLATVPLPGPWPSNVTISPDGSRIALTNPSVVTEGAADAVAITILDVAATANPEASTENPVTIPLAGPASLRFSPDGKRLFVSGIANRSKFAEQQSMGAAFDVVSGKRLFSLPDNEPWFAASLSPDGKWLAVNSFSRPRTVTLLSTAGDRQPVEFQGHTSRVVALAFGIDSQRLLTAAANGQIKTWDISAATRYQPQQLASATQLPSLMTVVSYDGTRIASIVNPHASQATLEALTSESRKNVVTVRDDVGNMLYQTPELVGPINWLKFSADGHRLAACAVAADGDLLSAAQLCVWDAASGAERLTLRLPARDESFANQIRRTAPTAAFSPDGRQLAVIHNFGSRTAGTSAIETWQIGERRQEWKSEKVPWLLSDLKFSPDGARIVNVPYFERMSVWDAKVGQLLWSTSHQDLSSINFSADGSRILSHHMKLGEIQILDSASGKALLGARVPDFGGTSSRTHIVLSPDGSRLVASQSMPNSSSARVWDVNRPDRELVKLVGHSSNVQAIAFSPDNARIVTSSLAALYGLGDSGEIKLWDADTGHELLTLRGAARSLAFNASGTLLTGEMGTAGLGDSRVQRWDASRLAPQVEAEQMVEAFTTLRGTDVLPLMSEILARIDSDQAVSAETRAAAVTLVNGLRREKELHLAAWLTATLPDQPREKYERALHYLEEGCATDPDNRESWSTRGLVHFRLGQSTEALAAMLRSQELHAAKKLSLTAEDWTILAMTQHQAGRPDEARSTLENVRATASRKEAAWQKLLAEAETLLSVPKAADEPEAWIGQLVMPRLDANPQNEHGDDAYAELPYAIDRVDADRLWLGKNSIARSQVVRLDDAIRYYTALVQADPTRRFGYYNRALVYEIVGEIDLAIEDYSAAIRLTPTNAVLWRARGEVLRTKYRFDEALADIDEALKLDASYAFAHVSRGIVRERQGAFDDALKSFDQAILLMPDHGWAYVRRAYVWSAKGDRDKMLQDFEKGIQLSHEGAYNWNARAWLLATSPNADHRDGKQAVADATKACELTGWRDYYALQVLAAAYAEAGDFEQAVKWQEKVVAMLPPAPAARSEDEARLKLYQDRQPFRDIPKNPPAADAASAPPTDPLVE